MVEVFLSLAILCIGNNCYPALIGKQTPTGESVLIQRLVTDPFYAGSILQFKESPTVVYAVHRVWRGKPSENRDQRLIDKDIQNRIITSGCINVSDEVYEKLLSCCQNQKIKISP